MSGDFNPEQKRYLEGFVAGLQIAKAYLAHRLAAGKFPPFHPPARDRCAAISDRRRDGRMILPRAPLPSLIPESAPFSAEQRVWLNGLFAGLLSLERGVTPLSLDQAAALLPGALDLAAPAIPAARTTARHGTTQPCRSPIA